MADIANKQINGGRAAALERRRALSTQGKAGLGGPSSSQRSRSEPAASVTAVSPARSTVTAPAAAKSAPHSLGRAASQARRAAMSSRGKAGITATNARLRGAADIRTPESKSGDCGCDRKGERRADGSTPCAGPRETDTKPAIPASGVAYGNPVTHRSSASNTLGKGRLLAQARRQALAKSGKTAQTALKNGGVSVAQLARQVQPDVKGRDLARSVREERSRNGAHGQRSGAPSGRTRPKPQPAQDAPWKVGVSETARGQIVTGTVVGRSRDVTGDEPSTCRVVTGTEYMGADIFREFCKTDAVQPPPKVGVSSTGRGTGVTGTVVGRGERVTGDEPGTCQRVTGTEYVGARQAQAFCGTVPQPGPSKIGRAETLKGKVVTGNMVGRSGKVTGDEAGAGRKTTGAQYMQPSEGVVPPKVGMTSTLRGGSVTGTLVGRGERVTGNEPGSCRNITGDEYLGQEQFKTFCANVPAPQDAKVGVSRTLKGETVTGTMTGRSTHVTGDEPGTCKNVTGTPYVGIDQYDGYCEPAARPRAQPRSVIRATGSVMSGPPGAVTGEARGAGKAVSGTPYIGAKQYADDGAGSAAAMPGSPDFPQAIGGGAAWTAFSVSTPAREAQIGKPPQGAVTGTSYEQGNITGPFGMGGGKVTGTEQFRFGLGVQSAATAAPIATHDNVATTEERPRVTGEGMAGASRITGDDWDRGDRVTGTEGRSATRRNPTRRGATNSITPGAQAVGRREKEATDAPLSKVTGAAGTYERGAVVTLSGGARG